MSEASRFISGRKAFVTKNRIKAIVCYLIKCYKLTLKDNAKYSKTWVKNNTSLKFENYLRNRLVEDYLIKNKDVLKQRTPALNEINFTYETEKEYIDLENNKIKSDKIDIYVNKLGLQREWNDYDENIYFAVECKRIKETADCDEYKKDIDNFILRRHQTFRLPFEGQIAFLENPAISHISAKDEVNRLLCKDSQNLLSKLAYTEIEKGVDYTYLSQHKRNYQPYEPFSIFHLLLDYSSIVTG